MKQVDGVGISLFSAGAGKKPGTAGEKVERAADPEDRFQPEVREPEPPEVSLLSRVKRKVGRWASRVASGARLAATVIPTVGSLVAARELARLEGLFTGEPPVSAIEWLRARTPKLFSSNVERLMGLASGATEKATGLSLNNLVTVEKHFYTMLAPERGSDGLKKPPCFLEQLSHAPFREPGAPHAAYVYLGDGREKESREIMRMWNGSQVPGENPFDPESDLHRVWEVLEYKAGKGDMPVFVDLDGDARTFVPTEFIAKETLASMVARGNEFGDGFKDAGSYYTWLNTRLESFYQRLDPWMKGENPRLHSAVEQIKQDLTPPWLGGGEGLGPFPAPERVDRAYGELKKLADSGSVVDFADAAVSLDRDLLSGVQTHWVKLLREVGSERRRELFRPLARAWVDLSGRRPGEPGFEEVSPAKAPILIALEGPPAMSTMRRYDRAAALGEVVDHTLDGLGILERRELMAVLREELAAGLEPLQAREAELRGRHEYAGVDLAGALTNPLEQDLEAQQKGLDQLREILTAPGTQDEEAYRHWALADWMVHGQRRYGDVQFGLLRDSQVFSRDPLAVSEYFQQTDLPDMVTMMCPGPRQVEWLGGQDGDPETRVSLVFEGGGGKGFAHVESLKQVRSSMAGSGVRMGIDEYAGNSAGAINAVLLAAGYTPDEMGTLMERLDFKKFNSDAIWLMGGADPKVRGVNRTGIFSMQKMYRELHSLLSEKLGIEGRPILFRDLPFKLSVTATVMNTDLPAGDPLRRAIDSDGRMVLSSQTTPNFDVVGAVIASAAVPGFFNAPQMEVARGEDLYRIQFVDGGVVDNLPISTASRDGNRALVVAPALYEAVDPATGQKITLDTLDFDTAGMPVINQAISNLYSKLGPKMSSFFSEAKVDRAVVALNLTRPEEQKAPLIAGADPGATRKLHETASEVGLDHLEPGSGRKMMQSWVNAPSLAKRAAGAVFELFLDGTAGEDDQFSWGWSGSKFRVGRGEEEEVLDILRGAGAAGLAASTQVAEDRLFERS